MIEFALSKIDHLRARACLCTDCNNDWKSYERRKFKRRGPHCATWEERGLIPRELYLYDVGLPS